MENTPDHYKYQAGQLEALRALIATSPRSFSLNLAVCSDSTLRSHLVQQLQAGFPAIDHAMLNSSPPRWRAWFACPVISWVNGQTADTLREEAKYFWEWQSGLFRIDA